MHHHQHQQQHEHERQPDYIDQKPNSLKQSEAEHQRRGTLMSQQEKSGNTQIKDETNVHSQSINKNNNNNNNDNNSCSSSESEDSTSFCRHCLRPQSELQVHYLRPSQARDKFRPHKNSQSSEKKCQPQANMLPGATVRKSGQEPCGIGNGIGNDASRMHMGKQRRCQRQVYVDATNLVAANAEVRRFRSPQVGPLVGHNIATVPMHFHHPLQIQQHQQQQHHYTYKYFQQPLYASTTMTMESERSQNLTTATTTRRGTTTVAAAKKTIRPTGRQNRHARHKEQQLKRTTTIELPILENAIENYAQQLQHTEQNLDEVGLGSAETAASDSPSLVKVHTWYTVAKQGLSY